MCRSTCFGRFHAHHQELTTALTASGFNLERGGSSVIGRGLAVPARPRPTTLLPPLSKLKPEAVNAVVSSWWWAWKRPKHVEWHINVKWKTGESVASGWLICSKSYLTFHSRQQRPSYENLIFSNTPAITEVANFLLLHKLSQWFFEFTKGFLIFSFSNSWHAISIKKVI